MECITSNTLRRVPGNEFNGLDNPIDDLYCPFNFGLLVNNMKAYLVLNTRVFTLGILTDQDGVDVVIGSLETVNGHTRPDVGEEVEGPSEGKVEGNVTLSNCRNV